MDLIVDVQVKPTDRARPKLFYKVAFSPADRAARWSTGKLTLPLLNWLKAQFHVDYDLEDKRPSLNWR